ncbi:hypothetical protein GCM10008018_51910 [Paenibacillus marchantiophytorum]|uniref:DUF3866 family protein n=1 Tax=Paenibacillus marchantiophytorum TaxID=1619310 RepID=A0ABQ1F4P0_9BACL|nr:DUF3866 family protein [Paenibacillus marchantiophytorum]GFZ99299.1 hypothetical protein GCM10008018_51910 [Paenibacillus marchantiophytorum]
MMIKDSGRVERIDAVREGLQMVSVRMRSGDLAQAVHYTDTGFLLVVGDWVGLNVTAFNLGLSSGGFHIVVHKHGVDEEPLEQSSDGHIMKLKYTPMQRSVMAVEEPVSAYHTLFNKDVHLDGMLVLLGELHSMLPVVMCWLQDRQRRRGSGGPLKVAYIMTDGGALPLRWSQHVAHLEALGWIGGAITYGQAYGGSIEAVNKFSALLAAKHVVKADLCVVTMGPGMVGTGTRYGYSGLEIGELVNAVHVLRGTPIVIPRLSFADLRERHRGISHHTLTALELAAVCPAHVPLPSLAEEQQAYLQKQVHRLQGHILAYMPSISLEEMTEALARYPVEITSMGRGLRQDPAYFQAICSAAEYAGQIHNRQQ